MQADVLRAPVGPGAIHVERYGHGGTAVILLHGFGTCNFLSRAIAPAITSAGHTAYSVDLLGHAQSDRPMDADFGIVADPEHMPMKLIARYLAPFVGKDGAKHLLTLASAVNKADLDEDEYGEIKAPTLIIWGDEDKWVDPKLADRLVNTIPDARLVRLGGVARLVPEENPEHLSELLLDFIKRRAAA